jgi:hypothetical protein
MPGARPGRNHVVNLVNRKNQPEINTLQVVPRKKETKPDNKGDPSPQLPDQKNLKWAARRPPW